jgi:transcriptional regulator
VPTWNYIAVHCYGKGTVVIGEEEVSDMLDKMIDNYEPSYKQQWHSLPAAYRAGMISAIVAFEIVVDDIQGKKHLSQNKNENERKKIIETLSTSSDTNEKLIAEYMRTNSSNTDHK